MSPHSIFGIARSLIADGIFMMTCAAQDNAFIRAHSASDLEKQSATLRKMASDLDVARAQLIANAPEGEKPVQHLQAAE